MLDRAHALAEVLRAAGHVCEVDHDVVILVDAPKYTEARVHVGADVDGYVCSFAASREHERMCEAPGRSREFSAKAWANWTLDVRERVAAAWSELETLELPAARPTEPAPACEPRYDHEYALWLPVDAALEHAYAAASRECRFAVVQEWRAWGKYGGEGYDAPRVTWHEWAHEVAADLGVAQGWASVAGQTIDAGHPAAPHVQRVLVAAASHLEAPAGIVALDVRGLTLATVEALVRALVDAARGRFLRDGWARGGIILCDYRTATYLGRCVPLHAS